MSDNGDRGSVGGELCELGTSTGLAGSYSVCFVRVSSRGRASTGLVDGEGRELAGLGCNEELLSKGRPWRLFGRELRLLVEVLFPELLAVMPCAWASDGSGGAAVRLWDIGIGCLTSRFAGTGREDES
jgi:hypothetical protein